MKRGAQLLAGAALFAALPLSAQDNLDASLGAAPAAAPAAPTYVEAADLDAFPKLLPRIDYDKLPEVVSLKSAGRTARLAFSIRVDEGGQIVGVDTVTPSGVPALDAAIRDRLVAGKTTIPRKDGAPVAARLPVNLMLGYVAKQTAGHEPELTDEIKALGHHGTVVVSGTIQPDGKLGDLALAQSSQSDLINAAALAAASSYAFEPTLDPNGVPMSRPARFEFEMSQAFSQNGVVSGLPNYGCDAFVKELDWWRSVNPGLDDKEYRLRKVLVGLMVLTGLDKSNNPQALVNSVRAMDGKWEAAIATCRTKPGMKFLDVFKKGK